MGFLQNLLHDITGGHQNAPAKAAPQAANRDPRPTMIPYADPNQAAQSMQRGQGFIPYSNPAAASATIPQALRQPVLRDVLRAAVNTIGQNQHGGYPNAPMTVGVPNAPAPQGGAFNPGRVQLQAPGIGGYASNMQGGNDVNWQNTDGRLRNMVNPQISDNGYYYNQ